MECSLLSALLSVACGNEPASQTHVAAAARSRRNTCGGRKRDSSERRHGARPSHQHSHSRGAPGAGEVTALGEVVADQARYAEVAPPTSGQVVRVLVETNGRVGRGTPLAQLRSTDLGRARADLLSAEARRDLARQTLDRKRTLAAERIVAASRSAGSRSGVSGRRCGSAGRDCRDAGAGRFHDDRAPPVRRQLVVLSSGRPSQDGCSNVTPCSVSMPSRALTCSRLPI